MIVEQLKRIELTRSIPETDMPQKDMPEKRVLKKTNLKSKK